MAIILGHQGNVRLRRRTKASPHFFVSDQILPDDVNTSLNRLSFDSSLDNFLIGDKIDLRTSDPRGLIFFDASAWGSGQVEDDITAYVHVNQVGGLRFFNSFADAVNNNRSAELALGAFAGEPLEISASIRDVNYNILGNVSSYEFSADRESIDITSLSDKFKYQYSAGLLSGTGRIDTFFDPETSGIKETNLLMLQLIQRLDIGSEFDLYLYLTDKEIEAHEETIFYDLTAVITKAGVSVGADDTIRCSIDFVTTGELKLMVGTPAEYILKEDDDRIELEQSLDFLLKEVED